MRKVPLLCHWRGDGDIAEAFFRYYSEHACSFHLILHGAETENARVLSMQEHYPIVVHDVYDGNFDDFEKMRRLQSVVAAFGGKWLLLVDSDEFVEFPGNSVQLTIDALEKSGSTCMAAPMVQRLRLDGSLDSPDVVPDPWCEFPVCSKNLYELMGSSGSTRKHPLFLCGRETKLGPGNHSPANGKEAVSATVRGATHHFKWRRSVVPGILHRIEIDWPWAGEESVPYFEYLSTHGYRLPLEGSFVYSREEMFRRKLLKFPV